MQDDLRMLADEIRACTACPLHRSARQGVPGEGSAESGIFFLGEAPGYNEDLQGRPFVGAAGQLLDELLAGIGLDRTKVFITNVVRHRPPENRDPLPDEVTACDMWLRRHLEVLTPKVVDAGLMFPDEEMLGIDLVIPDTAYLKQKKDRVRGIVLTHAHEDHMGALPYVLRDMIEVPVYGTKLTLGLMRTKLREHKLADK